MSNIAHGTARKTPAQPDLKPLHLPNGPARQPYDADPEAVAEVARYIAQLTAEMCQMAGSVKLDTLAYFLSMARLEAEMLSRRDWHPAGLTCPPLRDE